MGRLEIQRVVIEEGGTAIERSAFWYCRALKEVDLPDTLQSIGEHAFSDCASLREVNFPDSIKFIGRYAFVRCKRLNSETIQWLKEVG